MINQKYPLDFSQSNRCDIHCPQGSKPSFLNGDAKDPLVWMECDLNASITTHHFQRVKENDDDYSVVGRPIIGVAKHGNDMYFIYYCGECG